MTKLGIVEGFFGPSWSHESRISFAPFLNKYGGKFYIYAPKRDPHLRKSWREGWSEEYLRQLQDLRDAFHSHQIKFGVGLSPFGLGSSITELDWAHLKNRFETLAALKIDYLGLFFDDMPATDDLLSVQTQVVKVAQTYFPQGLIFCPSYYSYDPILDKVFGQRPKGYVEGLKEAIPVGVDICWTGPKVISEEISRAHLEEVTQLLGRKPFIWENLYANDGPRNCKFLKLRYFTGRDDSLESCTSGVGLNLMNQPYLSKILYLSTVISLSEKIGPEEAFEKSCRTLCSEMLASFIIKNRVKFFEVGLDKISFDEKESFKIFLASENSEFAQELVDWLNGEYIVGPECLTD
jgi:hyaluronoglucosaminidase